MKNKMTLEINNFGPINKAKIDIGKINIITGANASGKTTSSKLLYSLLASVSFDGIALLAENIKDRFEIALVMAFSEAPEKQGIAITEFSRNINQHFNDLIELKHIINDFKDFLKTNEIKNEKVSSLINEIDKIFDFANDKEHAHKEIISTLLKKEYNFKNQVSNDTNISLYGKNKCDFELSMKKNENKVQFVIDKELFECLNVNDVVYTETPYILDLGNTVGRRTFFGNFNFHQDFLIEKLKNNSADKDVFDKELNKEIELVIDEINKIVEGNLYFDQKSSEFKFKQDNKVFDMKDTANGQKQIGIINLLLKNRKLSKDSYLIMDEPEVHLHPFWQLKLAEIIVLISKKANITIYINSHSPQFIEAIEAYSKYYGLEEDTNFYSTVYNNEKSKYDFKKIERKNIKEIYSHLGDIYKKIDEIKGENDADDILKEVN